MREGVGGVCRLWLPAVWSDFFGAQCVRLAEVREVKFFLFFNVVVCCFFLRESKKVEAGDGCVVRLRERQGGGRGSSTSC